MTNTLNKIMHDGDEYLLQDTTYTAGTGIAIDSDNEISNTLPGAIVSGTAPSSPTEGMVWYDTTDDALKTYDGTNWNITGKEYEAGDGIAIGEKHRDTQGPCPDGFHIPTVNELKRIKDIYDATGNSSMSQDLKLPLGGHREDSNYDGTWQIDLVNSNGYYWAADCHDSETIYGLVLSNNSREVYDYTPPFRNLLYQDQGNFIRAIKDTSVVPDNSRTTINTVNAGTSIKRSQTLGLISISSDGNERLTIQDKNVGATTVWNYGDALTIANTGNTFQRGNNYSFPSTLDTTTTITYSDTRVDASGYGPGNYYNSNISVQYRSAGGLEVWDSSYNENLWGGVSDGVWVDNNGGSVIATRDAVLVFDMPKVGDNIGDIISYLSGGGGVVFRDGGTYYMLTISNSDSIFGKTIVNGYNIDPVCSSVWLTFSRGVVSNISYRSDEILTNRSGTAGQVLTKTASGYGWATPSGGDVKYSDFEIATATSGATLTISDLTTEFVPTVDFTMSAGTVKEGMQYIVRLDSGATAYTLTLGAGITNPFGEDLTLTASKMTTVVLFATSSSALEVFSVRTAS